MEEVIMYRTNDGKIHETVDKACVYLLDRMRPILADILGRGKTKPIVDNPESIANTLLDSLFDETRIFGNGKKQWHLMDLDHGTRRIWGAPITNLYFFNTDKES